LPRKSGEREKKMNTLEIKNVLIDINEILIPLRFLPSKVKLPKKFIAVKVTIKRRHTLADPEYYFLVYKKGLMDIERKVLYYRTNAGKVYSIPISKSDLPKELSAYSRGVHLLVARDPQNDTIGVLLLPNLEEILNIKGDLDFVNEERFVVSLMFHVYPHILSYLNQ
jgi:hypothetical protein